MRSAMQLMRMLVGTGVVVAAACTSNNGCLEIDGPCPGPRTPASFILGFPTASVDLVSGPINGSGSRGVMHVGDTVTLHLVRDSIGEVLTASDTIRAVTWSMSDQSAASLVPVSGGAALLIGKAPGRVGLVIANGLTVMYSCGPISGSRGCAPVGAIDVIAQ